jgi:3-oxoacyl-[acyl-carrier protein] reductase
MELELEGKSAIVAAGSKGLGLACAKALAREGANVTIFSRTKTSLDSAEELIGSLNGGRVHSVTADLRSRDDLERVVNETVDNFGGVDILVNNSGGPVLGPFSDVTEDDWLDGLQSEVMSVVRLCKLVIPLMKSRGGGRIINITTVGVIKPQPGLVLSDATRHCVLGLAQNLALELAEDNILVNTVCPGPISTERLEEAIQKRAEQDSITLEESEQYWLNLIPLHRFGEPRDLADLVAFLASDRGGFITGTVTQIDGGKAIA